MDLYTTSLLLGGIGLGTMAVGGLVSSHGGHEGGHVGHHGGHDAGHLGGQHAVGDVSVHHTAGAPVTGHGASVAHAHGSASVVPQGARGAGRGTGRGGGASRLLWMLLSPRVLFSVVLGLGATGLLLRGLTGGALGGVLLFALALLGGALFEAALVRPVWNLLLRFESAPALTLESALFDEARAVSRFDAHGQGLVALDLDGQVVQVLATLRPEDRAAGVVVRAGDVVRIEAVDAARNRCTVAVT